MGDETQPKPVEKIADDIIKDDVKKQGQAGRPGKGRGVAQLPVRPKLLATVSALVLLAGAATVYYLVNRDYSKTTLKPEAAAPPTVATAPAPSAAKGGATSAIDNCLLGTWEAVTVRHVEGQFKGATGFRLTFKPDGTQVADYSSMRPVVAEAVTFQYKGVSEGHIATEKGVATSVSVEKAGAMVEQLTGVSRGPQSTAPMGPGALGTNKNDNSYRCSGDALDFVKEDYRGQPFWQITMRRAGETTIPQTRSR